MKMERKFTVRDRFKSFRFAYSGLKILIQTQHNFRIQLASAAAVIILSWWLEIGLVRNVLMLLSIGLVLIAEAFNTVFELVVTLLSPSHSVKAKRAKDVAAAGVLLAALISSACGLIILMPPLLKKIGF